MVHLTVTSKTGPCSSCIIHLRYFIMVVSIIFHMMLYSNIGLSVIWFYARKIFRENQLSITMLSAPDGPHVGPMNLAIRVYLHNMTVLIENTFSCSPYLKVNELQKEPLNFCHQSRRNFVINLQSFNPWFSSKDPIPRAICIVARHTFMSAVIINRNDNILSLRELFDNEKHFTQIQYRQHTFQLCEEF